MKDLKKELHTLQTLISEDFAGVLWFTNEALKKELAYYEALDYLVDGALELLFQNQIHPEKNLIMSSSFKHPFFVAHFNTETNAPEFNQALQVLSKETLAASPKILLLGEIGLELENKIKEANPLLQFEVLVS